MSVAAGRFKAGDFLLAAGAVVLLFAILAHVAAAPATTPTGRSPRAPGSDPVPVAAGVVSSSSTPAAEAIPVAVPAANGEPRTYAPNSRSIKSWKDLPVHMVHRPHWISSREHPKSARGTGMDYGLRTAEMHLELLGFDADSIQRGIGMVNRIDAALLDVAPGDDVASRLLELARGGDAASALAEKISGDGGSEAVRVRAIALLAARTDSSAVDPALRALAKSDPSDAVRSAAAISLLWRSRSSEAAEWISGESSSRAVSDFFESVQAGGHRLQEPRPAKTLIFMASRVVESSALVDVLVEGAAPARWDADARAKMYGIAALYGGERADVGPWMEREYDRATEDLIRASILFTAPQVAQPAGLEDRAIEVARAGGSGYVVRTALYALGQFRTEKSMRALMDAIPRCADDTAGHAVRALAGMEPWFGREIEPYLRTLAAGHSSRVIRDEAAAALQRNFRYQPR